jgi:hypothetical protein
MNSWGFLRFRMLIEFITGFIDDDTVEEEQN